MSAEVGSAHVSVFPVMTGFKGTVQKGAQAAGVAGANSLQSGFAGAGTRVGTTLGTGMKAALSTAAGDLGAVSLGRLNAQVAAASAALSKARLRQQDVDGTVRVAEARLSEAIAKSGAESATAIAAEERLASARRVQQVQTDAVTAASVRLAAAQAAVADASTVAAVRSTSGFSGILSSARGALSSVASFASGIVSRIKSVVTTTAQVGGIVALTAGLALGGLLATSIKAGAEVQSIAAQTNAVITSTGGVAGRSADQVDLLSTKLSNLSGIDDETVKGAANLLLTFTNIRGTTFDKTLASAQDLSVAMGKDLPSAALTLGKALNDPVAGITRLQRVGVAFSQQQKDQIANYVKLGQTAQAQQVILDEVNREFGGSAAAAGATFAGTVDRIQTTLHNLEEDIGGAFLPAFTKVGTGVANILGGLAVNPKFEAWLDGISAKVTSKLTPLTTFLTTVANSKDPFGTLVTGLSKASPLFALLSTIVTGLQPELPQLQAAFAGVGTALSASLAQNGPAIATALASMLTEIVPLIPAILQLIPPLLQLAVAVLPPLVQLLQFVSTQWTSVATGAQTLFSLLSGDTSVSGFLAVMSGLPGLLGTVEQGAIGAGTAIGTFFGNALKTMSNFGISVFGVFSQAGSWLVSAGRAIVQGLIDGITSMVVAAQNAVRNVLNAIARFLPHSPAQEGPFSGKGWTLYSGQAIVGGLADGMDSQRSVLEAAAARMTAAAQIRAAQVQGVVTAAIASVGAGSSAGAGSGQQVAGAPGLVNYGTIQTADPDELGDLIQTKQRRANAIAGLDSALRGGVA